MNEFEQNTMKIFRSFKLGNSYFKNVVRKTPEQIEELNELPIVDIDRIIKNEQADTLSHFILDHYSSAIEKTTLNDGTVEYRVQLLVLKMEDFKSIVEAAICELSDYQIQRIKDGKTINQIIC